MLVMNPYKNFGEDPCTHTRAQDVNARICDEASVRAFNPLARMWVHESSPNLWWHLITNIRTFIMIRAFIAEIYTKQY